MFLGEFLSFSEIWEKLVKGVAKRGIFVEYSALVGLLRVIYICAVRYHMVVLVIDILVCLRSGCQVLLLLPMC